MLYSVLSRQTNPRPFLAASFGKVWQQLVTSPIMALVHEKDPSNPHPQALPVKVD